MFCIGRLCACAVETKTTHIATSIATVVLMLLDFLNSITDIFILLELLNSIFLRLILPNDFQCKLNLPRRGLRRCDAAESGNLLSGRADYLKRPAALVYRQCGRRKVGAI